MLSLAVWLGGIAHTNLPKPPSITSGLWVANFLVVDFHHVVLARGGLFEEPEPGCIDSGIAGPILEVDECTLKLFTLGVRFADHINPINLPQRHIKVIESILHTLPSDVVEHTRNTQGWVAHRQRFDGNMSGSHFQSIESQNFKLIFQFVISSLIILCKSIRRCCYFLRKILNRFFFEISEI